MKYVNGNVVFERFPVLLSIIRPILRRNWKRSLSIALLAIGATIVGDSFYELFTWISIELPGPRELYLAGFVFLVFLTALFTLDDILRLFSKPTEGEVDVTDLDAIEPPDALIVFVSLPRLNEKKELAIDPKTGRPFIPAYETAINRLFRHRSDDTPRGKRYVFLVHSPNYPGDPGSKEIASEYRRSNENDAPIEIQMDGLEADFNRIEECHNACSSAIQRARKIRGVKRVAIDITGGTKLTSAAAVLAGLEERVELCYIQGNHEKGPFRGIVIDWVDVVRLK